MTDSKLAETTKAVGKLFGTAAQLAQKQAALATLNNVTVPKLYHAIGKKIVSLEKLPPDLVPHREKIRALEAGINTKPDELPAAPAEGFAAKAKHLAQQAAQKASKATADAAATMQIQAAYVGLGKEAVEKYGEKAIPKEFAAELAAAFQSRETLGQEIAALKVSGGVGFFTPQRALLAGLAAMALAVAYVAMPRGRGVSDPRRSQEAPLRSTVARNDRSPKSMPPQPEPESVKRATPGPSGSPEAALQALLGDTSQHYLDFGFKGVTLGESFDQVSSRKALDRTRRGQPYLYVTPDGEGFVFSRDGALVCYTRAYQGGTEDYLAALKEMFGTTDKPILEREDVRSRSAAARTYIRHTFPRTLVLIEFSKGIQLTGGMARQGEGTHVYVLDRKWAEGVLAQSAQSQARCIEWLKRASSGVRTGHIDAAALGGLQGLRIKEWTGGRTGLALIDVAREKKWKAKGRDDEQAEQVGTCARAALAGSGLPPEASFDMGRYESTKPPVFLRAEADADSGDEGEFYALDHTPFLGLLHNELTCLQMQQMFPPKTDEIRFVQKERAGMTMGSGWYEWGHMDEGGGSWTVRSGRDGSIQVEFLGNRSL